MEKQLYALLESLTYSDGERTTETFTILVHEDENGCNKYQIQHLNPDWCVDVYESFDVDDEGDPVDEGDISIYDWSEDQEFDKFDAKLCIELIRKEGLK